MSNTYTAKPALGSSSVRFGLTVHTATLVAFYTASSAPTPLYPLYQAKWSLSAGTLTLIYGVYPLALLCALIVGGKLSDHMGRRPVASLATLIMLVSLGMMLVADGSNWLVAARIVQGLATGVGAVALVAASIDLDHQHGTVTSTIAPSIGMALGALGTAALVQLAPAPFHLIYVLLSIIFVMQLLLTWRVQETVYPRPGAMKSLRPSIAIPPASRSEFLAITPFNVSTWALGGFFMSLMPSLIVKITGSNSAWLSGISVATITLSSIASSILMRKASPSRQLIPAAILLAAGMVTILVGASYEQAIIFLAGCAVAGLGVGSGLLGSIRSIMPLAEPSERAGLMAAFYVESYLANSLPAMLSGHLAASFDLMAIAKVFGAAIVLLSLISLVLSMNRGRDGRRATVTTEHNKPTIR